MTCKWPIAALVLAITVSLRAQTELPEETDPNYSFYFSSGQYHEIFARAMKQISSKKGNAALAHYRIGYAFERGLHRPVPALAHYYAGLKRLEGAPDARIEGLLTAAIERALQTCYEQVERPLAYEISVLVKGKSEILAPAKDISVGRAPQGDTRYRLTAAPVPLDRKWVHIQIDRSGEEESKLRVGDRGRRFLANYRDTEFRVHTKNVIRFFVEERTPARPDTAAVVAGYANFARRYAHSPLASWARKRVRELEGGLGSMAGAEGTTVGVAMADVDMDIPRSGLVNSDAVAVVIGNRNYAEHHPDVPDVEFALRDAAVVKQYLTATLGFQEGNILFYENATNAVFRSVFGTRDLSEGRLAQLVKPGKSDLFVYYSGHGAPDVTEKQGYFVPVDCAPGDVRLNGYPLKLFYENLQKIESRSATVVIDACFSGGSQQGMLIAAASPVGIRVTNPALGLVNGAVFTSSSRDEISSWYPEMGHGLFTYFFLKGLRGEADTDGDGNVSTGELRDFVTDRSEGVPYWARRLYQGRQQTPGFYGDAERMMVEVEQ